MMDLRQLKYFLMVAEERQITRAAKRLHMKQPPLSRQMNMLEQELGVSLFDRSGKGLELTEAGELLKQKAESLIIQFDEMKREVQEVEEGIRGELSIGSVVSCISHLPTKIAQFRSLHPQVTFKISEGDHYLLGEQLERRVIDLVITRLPFEAQTSTDQYDVLPLSSDPFVAVIPSAWTSYATKASMTMQQLASFPFLALKTDHTTQMHKRVMDECRQLGFELSVICECSSVSIIMSLIAEGIGATVFPKSVMSSFPSTAVTMLEIEEANFHSDVGIVWLKNRYLSTSAQHFINLFRTD